MSTSHEERKLEYALDAGRGSSVFQSCARQLDLPLEVVARAAATNTLGKLIEQRGGRRTPSRRDLLRGHLARYDQLLRRHELMSKQVPDW
jgi:hypothetical protein